MTTGQPSADHPGTATQDGWAEGRDGVNPSYREWLLPGPMLWACSLLGVLALAVAYGKALGAAAGLVLGIGGVLLALAVILGTAAQVQVDSRVLRAGRARLPLGVVGRVIVADREAYALARGAGGDPTAHMVSAIGVHTGVVVEVADPADPHRTWLVASRHPADLARAVRDARGKVSP